MIMQAPREPRLQRASQPGTSRDRAASASERGRVHCRYRRYGHPGALWGEAGALEGIHAGGRWGPMAERKKENRQPKGGMGGRHAATTQGF